MSTEEIIQQFQQIVVTLKRVIEASGTMAERIDGLEHRSGETFEALNSIKNGVEALLKTYQAHTEAQNQTNTELIQTVMRLEARLTALEGHGHIM